MPLQVSGLTGPSSSASDPAGNLPKECIDRECATRDRYKAHSFCKHPNQVLPPGENWTQYAVFYPCELSKLAAKHARDQQELAAAYCSVQPYIYVDDPLLSAFCAQCDYRDDSQNRRSASDMLSDFRTRRDQWEYSGQLSLEELEEVQGDIDIAQAKLEGVAVSGPYNKSYWVLRSEWMKYVKKWDAYVQEKLDEEQRRQSQEEMDKAWDDARRSNNLSDAMETLIYAPGELMRLEEASSQSQSGGQSGSSSHSHRHRHRHGSSHGSSSKSSSKLVRWFGGGK